MAALWGIPIRPLQVDDFPPGSQRQPLLQTCRGRVQELALVCAEQLVEEPRHPRWLPIHRRSWQQTLAGDDLNAGGRSERSFKRY